MEENQDVVLESKDLETILKWTLKIPSYQRIYCWKEKTVLKLLNDLCELKENEEYCMGNIILQKNTDENGDEYYDIVDGQQRLVTLSLLIQVLDEQSAKDIKLLDQRFENIDAQKFIQYNKFLIENFCGRHKASLRADYILKDIILNVLILKDGSLDLAYTFFSNENSHGKPLTDYDLLKAHHLRYVVYEDQQRHLANRWDELMKAEKPKNANYKLYEQALAIYVFRLRKWLNFDWWDEREKYRVKSEYEASPVIEAVPPFCESFKYYEPIQGGTHFFEFTEQAIEKMKYFMMTSEYQMIHKLDTESFVVLRDVIEALLFAYFYKFGMRYLTEALLLITRYVSQVRYQNRRIFQSSVFEHVRLSKIPLLIEMYSSPTFFLAKMNDTNSTLMSLQQIKAQENRSTISDIRERYNKKLKECFNDINENDLIIKGINEWK